MQQTIQEITPRVDPRNNFPYRPGDEWTGSLIYKTKAGLYLAVLLRGEQMPCLTDYLVIRKESAGVEGKAAVLDEIQKMYPLSELERRRISHGATQPYVFKMFPRPGTENMLSVKIADLPNLPHQIRTRLNGIHMRGVTMTEVDALLSRTINAYPDLYS